MDRDIEAISEVDSQASLTFSLLPSMSTCWKARRPSEIWRLAKGMWNV